MAPRHVPSMLVDPIDKARRGRDRLIPLTFRERISDYNQVLVDQWPIFSAASVEGYKELPDDYVPRTLKAILIQKLSDPKFGGGKVPIGRRIQGRRRNIRRAQDEAREKIARWTSHDEAHSVQISKQTRALMRRISGSKMRYEIIEDLRIRQDDFVALTSVPPRAELKSRLPPRLRPFLFDDQRRLTRSDQIFHHSALQAARALRNKILKIGKKDRKDLFDHYGGHRYELQHRKRLGGPYVANLLTACILAAEFHDRRIEVDKRRMQAILAVL